MEVKLIAGIAEKNASLFRRLRVPLGDPGAWIEIGGERIALVRDLEMDRVRQKSLADQVTCPANHPPQSGLSGDRETATAQAVAQLLSSRGAVEVVVDRSLPYIFAWHLQQAGLAVRYDSEFAVRDRRTKTAEEIQWLADAQRATERVMQQACEMIAASTATADGTLRCDGEVLTSERLKSFVAIKFLQQGFTMGHGAIVATAPDVADCHHAGTGPLRTEVPIIIDLFPRGESSRYWGDCTRTVVHGQPSDTVRAMHRAVVAAKTAAEALLMPGNLASDVHQAAETALIQHGYSVSRGTLTDEPSIQHGTGHGIGLEVHEPILLDHGGGEMFAGEVFTVEPGLYGRRDGGVRIEDMVVVTQDGPNNLNELPVGLCWK